MFDAVDTVEHVPAGVRRHAGHHDRPDGQHARRRPASGFINATDCADYLTKKGMPFRDAYTVTGHLVAQCIGPGQDIGGR